MIIALTLLACGLDCGPGTYEDDRTCLAVQRDALELGIADTDTDTDTDADADTDTDADADTDSDADVDTGYLSTGDTGGGCLPGAYPLVWSSFEPTLSNAEVGIPNIVGLVDGPGVICSWTCADGWATPSLTRADLSVVTLPTDIPIGEYLRVLIVPIEPGTPGADVTTCTMEADGGPFVFSVRVD